MVGQLVSSAGRTVIGTGALCTVPLEAVMFATPTPTAVTVPLASTVAIPWLDDCQVNVTVTGCPPAPDATALRAWVPPSIKLPLGGVTTMTSTTGLGGGGGGGGGGGVAVGDPHAAANETATATA